MAQTFKRLIDGSALSTTTTTYFTATTKTLIQKLSFNNYDTSPRTVTLYLVPAGKVAANEYLICNACTIFPSETWSPPDVIGHILETGGTIQIKISSGTSVTVVASGVEIS